MNALEGGLAGLNNDADQMNDSVAALHAVIEAGAGSHVSRHKLNAVVLWKCGFRRITHQSANSVAVSKETLQQMPADETGTAGEKDLHRKIVESKTAT